jgi:cytochrome o ubiquinol oxidase subunit IV
MSVNQLSTTNNSGWSEKNIVTYVLGFILCLILTLFSFGLVTYKPISTEMIYTLLSVLAISQLIIQSVCFLGLKFGKDGRWNMLPFLFTLLIIFFIVGGSLWIMYNLNTLMMPAHT